MYTVVIKDEMMQRRALDLPLYFWAAWSLKAAGADFCVVASDEVYADLVTLCPDVLRATKAQGTVIDKAVLITATGAENLVKTGKFPSEGCYFVSDTRSLLAAQRAARLDVIYRHAERGVIFMDEQSCTIDPRAVIAPGAEILPHTVILGESSIGPRAKIGPFAYIRPGCTIGADTKIGDFVEVKNSTVGDGTKFSHLTYVGDSDIGSHVTFGCGTVTVNYDGKKKFRTTVKDNAFVGCNTNLIAPVTVGEGAYIAAGSTVTDDVPDGAFAIARARQTTKDRKKE